MVESLGSIPDIEENVVCQSELFNKPIRDIVWAQTSEKKVSDHLKAWILYKKV